MAKKSRSSAVPHHHNVFAVIIMAFFLGAIALVVWFVQQPQDFRQRADEIQQTNLFWSTTDGIPSEESGLAAAAVNNKIYAIGGNNYGNRNYEFANGWTTKAAMPTARGGLAVAVANNKIYAIGGRNRSGSVNTVEEYDPQTNTWTTKATMPTARGGLAVAVANNKIYAIGGRNRSGSVNTVEEYDSQTNTWTTKATMPTPRSGLAAASANGKIYAMGGTNSTRNAWHTTDIATLLVGKCQNITWNNVPGTVNPNNNFTFSTTQSGAGDSGYVSMKLDGVKQEPVGGYTWKINSKGVGTHTLEFVIRDPQDYPNDFNTANGNNNEREVCATKTFQTTAGPTAVPEATAIPTPARSKSVRDVVGSSGARSVTYRINPPEPAADEFFSIDIMNVSPNNIPNIALLMTKDGNTTIEWLRGSPSGRIWWETNGLPVGTYTFELIGNCNYQNIDSCKTDTNAKRFGSFNVIISGPRVISKTITSAQAKGTANNVTCVKATVANGSYGNLNAGGQTITLNTLQHNDSGIKFIISGTLIVGTQVTMFADGGTWLADAPSIVQTYEIFQNWKHPSEAGTYNVVLKVNGAIVPNCNVTFVRN